MLLLVPSCVLGIGHSSCVMFPLVIVLSCGARSVLSLVGLSCDPLYLMYIALILPIFRL